MTKYYKAKQIILPDTIIEDGYLGVENGLICYLSSQEPNGGEIIDFGDRIISAGLVDTHIHGYANWDVMDNDPEGLKVMAHRLPEMGITSWLPTTLTASAESLTQVCTTIAANHDKFPGAKIQGIFLEGPYFTEKYKGAQNAKYMSDPSVDQLRIWQEAAKGLIRKIAIAPERQGVPDFIKAALDLGIYVGLGHSDATLQEAKQAVDAGANIFIHIYNGMRGLHHREPGMVGAALTLPEVFCELIADGHHCHPQAAKLVTDSRGVDETLLITDCMRAGGLGDGRSRLGELEVEVKEGQARLVEGGNLAGSVLQLIDGAKNMVDWGHVSVAEALRMASYNPAKSVGLENQCGQLRVGMAADFIVVSPKVALQATYINGECYYQA